MENKIEKSIIKKFRKNIWSKFRRAVSDFNLVEEGDKIAVCVSGGKDSFLLAKCLEELRRHKQINFELVFIVMDPGFTPNTISSIKNIANNLNITLEIFEADIFDNLGEQNPCYLCARKRRGHLYNYAFKLGCNKIALGHHFSDVIETTLMSMLYSGEIKGMVPKIDSRNYKNIKLIRPLYYVHEEDIIKWVKYNQLNFIGCSCKFEQNKTTNIGARKYTKDLIKQLKKDNIHVEENIFASLKNVNLDKVLEYKLNDTKYNNFSNEEKRL